MKLNMWWKCLYLFEKWSKTTPSLHTPHKKNHIQTFFRKPKKDTQKQKTREKNHRLFLFSIHTFLCMTFRQNNCIRKANILFALVIFTMQIINLAEKWDGCQQWNFIFKATIHSWNGPSHCWIKPKINQSAFEPPNDREKKEQIVRGECIRDANIPRQIYR